jgi:hypothetical protein
MRTFQTVGVPLCDLNLGGLWQALRPNARNNLLPPAAARRSKVGMPGGGDVYGVGQARQDRGEAFADAFVVAGQVDEQRGAAHAGDGVLDNGASGRLCAARRRRLGGI